MNDSTTGMTTPSTSAESAPSVAPSSTPDNTTTTPVASTWDEAFDRAGVTGTSDPESVDAAADQPAPATTEPVDAAADPDATAQTEPKGAIPADRHKVILENTRRKTAEEVVARVEQAYGPAIQLQQQLRTDPVGTLQQLIDEAMDDPTMGPALLSHAARKLSAKRGQKVQSEEPEPDLQTADGTLVYSAGQLAKREAWMRAQIQQEIEARTAPFQQHLHAREQERVVEQARQQTTQAVKNRLGQWRARPGFTEHETDIAVKQAEYVQQGHDSWDALAAAYTDVYHEKVVPALHAKNQTNLVRTAVAKARASTDNPASVTPTQKQGIAKTWDEAFERAGLK